MKKIALTLVAMMTLTFGYAKTESFKGMDKSERYDMSCDLRRLAVTLDLTGEQMDAVEAIQKWFNNEMQSVATARRHERRFLVHEVVRKDIYQMRRVLNDKQFDTYMILLGNTLRNKHL